jgi:hypothetical protein
MLVKMQVHCLGSISETSVVERVLWPSDRSVLTGRTTVEITHHLFPQKWTRAPEEQIYGMSPPKPPDPGSHRNH